MMTDMERHFAHQCLIGMEKACHLDIQGASYRVFPECMKLGVKRFPLFTPCRQENALIQPYIHMTWEEP